MSMFCPPGLMVDWLWSQKGFLSLSFSHLFLFLVVFIDKLNVSATEVVR